jgi:hypothetical protein
MAAIDLILQCDQPRPAGGATTQYDGGAWPAGTFSFLVVARYTSAPTEDTDYLGVEPVPLLNQTIAADKQVRLDWVAAQDSAGNVRPPRAYDIF